MSGIITKMKLVLVLVLKLTFYLPWHILGLVFVSSVIFFHPPVSTSARSDTSVQRWPSLLCTIFPKHTKMTEKNFQVFLFSLCSSYPFNYCGWFVKFYGDFFQNFEFG